MPGSQDYAGDPRNETVLVYLNGDLVPRNEAKVSIFDAGFVLGDGVWEGVRLHKGKLVFLGAHLKRLFEGARAIRLEIGLDEDGVRAALDKVIAANKMNDGVHLRLMVTRGRKKTVNQDPRNKLGPPTIAIVAEWKEPSPDIVTKGLSLFTSSIRCTPREMFDMRLNSHSRLNLITALIEAIDAGADEALMLDPNGFVSSCNATNFFFVKDGTVMTSTGAYCFNGVTRANVIDICETENIPLRLGQFSLDLVHRADEAFVTGTFGGLTPVREIDGHALPSALPGTVTRQLRDLYAKLKDREAATR